MAQRDADTIYGSRMSSEPYESIAGEIEVQSGCITDASDRSSRDTVEGLGADGLVDAQNFCFEEVITDSKTSNEDCAVYRQDYFATNAWHPSYQESLKSESISQMASHVTLLQSYLSVNDVRRIRSQTPDDVSQSHDSGVSFDAPDSLSSFNQRLSTTADGVVTGYFCRNAETSSNYLSRVESSVDVSTRNRLEPSEVAPRDVAAERAAFRAAQWARLGRELDRCHLREVGTVAAAELRTPSPGWSAHKGVENFSVGCYYKSAKEAASAVTPPLVRAGGPREGLRSLDCNAQPPQLHYGGGASSGDGAVLCSGSGGRVVDKIGRMQRDAGSMQKADCRQQTNAPTGSSQFKACLSGRDAGTTFEPVPAQSHTRTAPRGATQESSLDRGKRPPHSYMNLIQMALCSDSHMRMTLREIYDWIETRFPYYKHVSNQGWKNSIRHNLSLYDIFVRKKASAPCKSSSSYWTMKCDDVTTTLAEYKERAAELNRSHGSVHQASSGAATVSPSGRQSGRKGPVPLLPKPSAVGATFTFVPSLPTVAYHTTQQQQPVVMSSTWLVGAAQQQQCGEATHASGIAATASLNSSSAAHQQPVSSATKRRIAAAAPSSASKRKRQSDAPAFSTKTRSRAAILPRRASLEPTRVLHASPDLSPLNRSLTLTIDTDMSLNLNTSALRHQLSFLKFEPAIDAGFAADARRESVEGSSFGGCSMESGDCDVQRGLPKPRIFGNRRRKQEFTLLRSPSDSLEDGKAVEAGGGTLVGSKHARLDPPAVRDDAVDDRRAESFPAVVEAQFSTPVRQQGNNDDDDLMLFTPFRLGGAANALLSSPSWLSPIRDLGCLGATPGAWGTLFLSPEREPTRTSTPCAHRTPDRASSLRAGNSLSRARESSAFRTPDHGGSASWRLGGGTSPDRLNKILFSEQSPPDIGFIVRSPNFRRLLGDFQDEAGSPGDLLGGGDGGGDLSGAFGFSPLR